MVVGKGCKSNGFVISRNQNERLLLIRIAAAVFISVIAYPLTLAEFAKTASVGNSTSQRLINFLKTSGRMADIVKSYQ